VVVPRPRIELGTRRFSVYQQQLTLAILQHLASIGQAAEQLLQTFESENSTHSEQDDKIDFSIAALEKMFQENKQRGLEHDE